MKESVVIGDQIATIGTPVMVAADGSTGRIRQIGRCGLIALETARAIFKVYAPSELRVLRKEEDEDDAG